MSEKPENADEQFLLRADAHIHLANEQLKEATRDKVCASIMFAAARFDAWTNACDAQTLEQMTAHREEAISYFVDQYRLMLNHHFDDYSANFGKYMGGGDAAG
jgi:hypothetical protein